MTKLFKRTATNSEGKRVSKREKKKVHYAECSLPSEIAFREETLLVALRPDPDMSKKSRLANKTRSRDSSDSICIENYIDSPQDEISPTTARIEASTKAASESGNETTVVIEKFLASDVLSPKRILESE